MKQPQQNLVNFAIQSNFVDVVALDNAANGVSRITLDQAVKYADELGLDVIQVGANTDGTPIVKIENYSSFMYNKKKKEKENLKKARANSKGFKEIKIGNEIAINDLNIKANKISELLTHNNDIQISIQYKGRQIKMIAEGFKLIDHLLNIVTEPYIIKTPAKIQGNRVLIVISSVNKGR